MWRKECMNFRSNVITDYVSILQAIVTIYFTKAMFSYIFMKLLYKRRIQRQYSNGRPRYATGVSLRQVLEVAVRKHKWGGA